MCASRIIILVLLELVSLIPDVIQMQITFAYPYKQVTTNRIVQVSYDACTPEHTCCNLCQVGGVATRLPAEQLYSRSSRELGFGDIAAIAERFHPDPFRTRQLSSLTSTTVLRYASSREIVNAAPPLLFLINYNLKRKLS